MIEPIATCIRQRTLHGILEDWKKGVDITEEKFKEAGRISPLEDRMRIGRMGWDATFFIPQRGGQVGQGKSGALEIENLFGFWLLVFVVLFRC